jgi:hypothetical protein
MTAVGFVGLLLGLLAWQVAFVNRTRTRVGVFLLAFVFHAAAAFVYHEWVQTNTADTILYYFDPYSFYGEGIGLGTQFVVYLVQFLKETIGGTYLDYFLLFQAAGFWGIAFLMRTLEEVYLELGVEQPRLSYLILFLPGIHFWTSAIGKDAWLFLGCSLAVWSAMRLGRRFIPFGIAIVIMILFRAHIALLALTALAVAVLFERRVGTFAKIALLVSALAGAVFVLGTVESTFNVDIRSAESVGDFLQKQSEVTSQIEGGTAVVGASYPVRLLSLLFRPFFFDAGGAFGLISSFENAFILFMAVTIFRYFSEARALARRVFFLRFAAVFGVVLALLLALVYYNVGLGLRQKMMFMPSLLVFFAALIGVRQARLRPVALSYA